MSIKPKTIYCAPENRPIPENNPIDIKTIENDYEYDVLYSGVTLSMKDHFNNNKRSIFIENVTGFFWKDEHKDEYGDKYELTYFTRQSPNNNNNTIYSLRTRSYTLSLKR